MLFRPMGYYIACMTFSVYFLEIKDLFFRDEKEFPTSLLNIHPSPYTHKHNIQGLKNKEKIKENIYNNNNLFVDTTDKY